VRVLGYEESIIKTCRKVGGKTLVRYELGKETTFRRSGMPESRKEGRKGKHLSERFTMAEVLVAYPGVKKGWGNWLSDIYQKRATKERNYCGAYPHRNLEKKRVYVSLNEKKGEVHRSQWDTLNKALTNPGQSPSIKERCGRGKPRD